MLKVDPLMITYTVVPPDPGRGSSRVTLKVNYNVVNIIMVSIVLHTILLVYKVFHPQLPAP